MNRRQQDLLANMVVNCFALLDAIELVKKYSVSDRYTFAWKNYKITKINGTVHIVRSWTRS